MLPVGALAAVGRPQVSVEGDKAPLTLGGMGEALLASLKANISELCFAGS